ncbi:MAG TPA: hemerythrin domain-containing protein [Candidatus Acidoferrales bacterium]|nr:hemerythrin domain-containing protein [Candidatus Acidoferrales bacterium]
MDILDVIRGEHRDVAAKLEEADRCEPGDARLAELAKEISTALATHTKIEERLFYSKLRDRSKDDERVDVYEAYTEHDVVAHLIDLLKSGRKPDEKFKAEMQVLGESVKHHVEEEESKVFTIARELMDQSERDELGEQWAKARKRADAQPPAARRRKAPARKKALARSKAPARSGSRRTAKKTPRKRR